MRLTIRRGAGINTVAVDDHTFDLNQMPPKVAHGFRRQLVEALHVLWEQPE